MFFTGVLIALLANIPDVYNILLQPGMLAKQATNGSPASQPNYSAGGVLCIILLVATIIVAASTYRFVKVPWRNRLNKRFSTENEMVNAAALEV